MESEQLRKYVIELLFFSAEFVNPSMREIISHRSSLGFLGLHLKHYLPIDDIDTYILSNYKKYVEIDEKFDVKYVNGFDDDIIFNIICCEIKIPVGNYQ